MTIVCHRCGSELPGETVRGFCAECGAPQIVLSPELLEANEVEGTAGGATTGAPPPPVPGRVRWAAALRSAAAVAAGLVGLFVLLASVGVPVLGLLGLLGAGWLAVMLYGRRTGAGGPDAVLDGFIGAQIGLMAGLLLAAVLAVALAAMGVLARYRLHAMAPFDEQMRVQMQMLEDRTAAQARAEGADPAAAVRELEKPELRAGMMLTGGAVLAGVLLLAGSGGGALAGSQRQGRPAAQ